MDAIPLSIPDSALCASDDSPIRLALCITELEVGGAERSLVELATRLDRRQFAPIVYSLGPRPHGQQAALIERLETCGVPTHFLDASTRWAAPLALLRLVRLLRAQRPHIVQTFLFHANVLGTIAARLAGVRTVLTGIRVAERRSRWHLVGARLIDRWVTRHVCVSQSVADFSCTHGGLDRAKLVVIANGVECSRQAASPQRVATGEWKVEPAEGGAGCFELYSPLSIHYSLRSRSIVFVGRLDVQKGADVLMELAPQILERLPGHDLVFVGRGPLAEELADQARRSAFASRIHLLGWRSDAADILAAAELVVLPSRWEGLSNVLLEAMAAGRPVVARDVEGVREAFGPEGLEQVVGHSPQDFADTVVAIAGSPAAQVRLGAANRQRAGEQFTLAAMVARYAELYRELAQRPADAPV